MPTQELKVGDVILTGTAQNDTDKRKPRCDLELVTNVDLGSIGGGYLEGWPGNEALVTYLTAGTRVFSDIIAVIAHLSEDDFVSAMRGWADSTPEQTLRDVYHKHPINPDLVNLDTSITEANYKEYL